MRTEAQKKWHAEHKNEKMAYDRKYRDANRMKVRLWHRQWYQRNRVKVIAKSADYWKRHPEKKAAVGLRYRIKHKDKIAAKTRAWYRANRAYALKRGTERLRKRLYGVTVEMFNAMIKAQKNKCPICSKHLKKPHIDHCHKTGKVRGILCVKCNWGLGLFQDDQALMRKAIRYLNRGQITVLT